MISAKPTENLTGIILKGNFDDFYWGVKNRLLAVCYDIRHAYMGDREVKLVDNGVHDEMMKWHSMILPKQEVHYAVKFLFPEAVFVALSAPDLYLWSKSGYGQRTQKQEETAEFPPQRESRKDVILKLCNTIRR